MATRDELYGLVGRAVADPAFGAKVLQDAIAAASSIGVLLSDEQKQWLSGNPVQWQSFLSLIRQPGGVQPLNCGTCIVDGH